MIGNLWSWIRNTLYDKNVLTIHRAGSFVISVGNLTWGGTGKTSLVMQLSRFLMSHGYRVAIVSRGYGRSSRGLRVVQDGRRGLANWKEAGDEAYLLAQRLPEAMVVVSKDRAEALRLLEECPVNVVLLDDAFQHRRVARDLDLVLVDASENLLEQRVIPFGKLREPVDSLKRADAIVLTHNHRANSNTIEWIHKNITAPVFHADYQHLAKESIGGKRIAAFCAISAPHHFFDLLKRGGAALVFSAAFHDHHVFTDRELNNLERKARESGAEALATTAKDAVRIQPGLLQMPFLVVQVELKLAEEEAFYRFVSDRLPQPQLRV